MPAVWGQADYDAAYQRWNPSLGIRQPSYRRNLLGPDRSQKAWIERARQWGLTMPGAANPASQVLVVGCGFGWIIETIVDTFNHNRIWGTEVSPWIQAEKATNARPDIAPLILDIDILAADARTQLRTAGAGQQGRFDWIISEQAVEGIPAVDLPTFLDACDGLLRPGGNVVHVVATEITPPGPDDVHDRTLDLRWQSHAAWIAERPAHLWLDVHGEGGWVMGGGV